MLLPGLSGTSGNTETVTAYLSAVVLPVDISL